MRAKKSAPIIAIDFFHGMQILVLHKRKHFAHFVKSNAFLDDCGIEEAWDDNGRSCVLMGQDGCPYFVLVLRNHSIRVIFHECIHMAHQICEARGIPISIENSEVIAYLADYLANEVIGCIRPDVDIQDRA